jgi:carnitine-CoA ligase
MTRHLYTVAGLSVPSIFTSWVNRTPDKPFLIWSPFEGPEDTWTYAEFWAASERVAAGLGALGVGKGSRVVLHMENCPEFILCLLASARLGSAVVMTNTKSSAEEIAYFAAKSGAIGVVTQDAFLPLFREPASRDGFFVTDGPRLARLVGAPGTVPTVACAALDEFSVQFTSGTTSRPKGVVWTQANAVWGAQTIARHLRLRHEDICQIILPLFHTNALSYSLLGTIWVGGTVLLQPRFSASNFWEPAVRHRATWCSIIPFCIKALLAHPTPRNHSFRMWGAGGALPELVDNTIGIKTLGGWGMTETVAPGIFADPEHPGPQLAIGRPVPGYDVEVRHDGGDLCGPDEPGRLYIRGVRGVTLFREYLDDPQATASSFDADGWFDTGDRVKIGQGGDFFFLGRDKDMLKVGGENVAASEIEAVLVATGLVSEAAVVGQKHPMLDEVPVAFVIPAVGAGDKLEGVLIAACREKLAAFKVPRTIHVVDSLPRSTLEKVSKNALRERLPTITE